VLGRFHRLDVDLCSVCEGHPNAVPVQRSRALTPLVGHNAGRILWPRYDGPLQCAGPARRRPVLHLDCFGVNAALRISLGNG
jgi:hypothetical protein